MIQQFTPDAPDEALANRVGFGRCDRGKDDVNATALGDALKLRAELAVVVADKKLWSLAKGRRVAQLLDHPRITR